MLLIKYALISSFILLLILFIWFITILVKFNKAMSDSR